MLPSEAFRVKVMKKFYNIMDINVKTKCRMDLGKFPHSQQTCTLEIGSYGYPDELLLPKLRDEYISQDIPHPNGYTIRIKKMKKTLLWEPGNFTTVGFDVAIIRHVSFYLLNYHIPTGLMVIMSFASFIIPASDEGLLGRIALLVTLVLVVTGIFNTAKSNLPASDVPN